MKRKSQNVKEKNISKWNSNPLGFQYNEMSKSNSHLSYSQNNSVKNQNSRIQSKSATDNKSIFQYFENGRSKSDATSTNDKNYFTKQNTNFLLDSQIDKEKMISEEVHIARKAKELQLINKGLNDHLKQQDNLNKRFRDKRENFGKIVFPLVIKTTLGLFKEIQNQSGKINSIDINEYFNSNRKLFLNCKMHTDDNTTDDCVKISISDEVNYSHSSLIGFISKEISVILKELMKIDYIIIKVFFDSQRNEIYVIVSFNNLKIYHPNVEFFNIEQDLTKTESDPKSEELFYRFKSSYQISNVTVDVLNRFYFNTKCLNHKLELMENQHGSLSIKINSEAELILKEIKKVICYKGEMSQDNRLNKQVESNSVIHDLDSIAVESKETETKKEDDSEFLSDQDDNKFSSFNQYLLMNIEYIFSTASSFSFLFHSQEMKYIHHYSNDLNELDKEILSKFLTRSTIWINKNKILNLFTNQKEEKFLLDSIEKLIQMGLIKTIDSIFLKHKENFVSYIDYKSEIFTYLFYLNNDELKAIQSELQKLTKYTQKVKSDELISDEIFVNNSFFRLYKFVDFEIFKEMIELASIEITKHNFEKKSDKENNLDYKTKNRIIFASDKNPSQNVNLKYISNFLNATNFKKVKIFKFNFTNKMSVIFNIIKTIDYFMNDKSQNLIEKFLFSKNSEMNAKNQNLTKTENPKISKNSQTFDKNEKILKIFQNFQLLTLNQTFAKVFDCATRLFFFYSDYKDINDVAKEFYGYENFEKFENFVTNKQILNEDKIYLRPIFTSIKDFKLYDNLYQIKNSYIINAMIFNSHELNYKIGINFCIYLMKLTNPNLIKIIFEEDFEKFHDEEFQIHFESQNFQKKFKKEEIENILSQIETETKTETNLSDNNRNKLEKLINLLLSTNFHFVDESFLSKYKHQHIAAEILNYFAETCEKLKKYHLAAFIFVYLLLSSHLNKKRGLWWYRLILIFNKYIKNKIICVKLLNKTSEDNYIKSGNLVKIKKYFEMFEKEKIKNNLLVSEKINSKRNKQKETNNSKNLDCLNNTLPTKSYLEELDTNGNNITKIRTDLYDEKLFIEKKRTIQADSVFSKVSGRRLYSINDDLVRVEEYALAFYNKLSYVGVHGENAILPALYNIFFWDIIFYDKIPFVFQSPYQTFPLDLFTCDFYKNRKELIDNRCKELSEFTESDVRNLFEFIFSKKKNVKSVFINWNSVFNDKEVLIKISIAIGMKRLALCFLEFAKNLKFMIKGMPDLFLWKENKNYGKDNGDFNVDVGNNKSLPHNKFKSSHEAIKESALLVEVKSKNDKLSDCQKYWLHFLTKIDVNVEVLHIA